MTAHSYKTIVTKAKYIKNNVEKDYKLGESALWSYYIAKAILTPKKEVTRVGFSNAPNPTGDHISNQIYKKDYLKVAKYLVDFVEKRNRLPNYIQWNNKKIRVRDYCYMFARILVYYDSKNAYPAYANINTKCWTKPDETGNVVFDYWVKKFGFKPKLIDDVCDYILKHFEYEYYYDDQKSNKQVIDSMAGNCTDLSQMLSNMADALGYDWKCIHTQCRQSGTGHVYLKLRKKGSTGNFFIRDVACIADESTYCVWCNTDTGAGYKLAENPSWWLANRQR